MFVKIYINEFLNNYNYYESILLFYRNYLKDDSLTKIMIIYEDGTEYIIKTPLLNKQETFNILAILFSKGIKE